MLPGAFFVRLGESYVFRITNGADGLRITHPPGAQPGRPELWIFGCSYTQGWGLSDEETYSWLIQRDMPGIEVVNFGTGAYGTVQSMLQLREALENRPAPRIAVLAYSSMHDERNTAMRRWLKGLAPYNRLVTALPYARLDREGKLRLAMRRLEYREFPLMRYSALVHFLEMKHNDFQVAFSRSREVSRALILEMNRECGERGVEFAVAGIGSDPDTRRMLDFCRRQGIRTADISVGLSQAGYTLLPFDRHPSAVANQEYARKLRDFLGSTNAFSGSRYGQPVEAG
jgi:hypothetical protein